MSEAILGHAAAVPDAWRLAHPKANERDLNATTRLGAAQPGGDAPGPVFAPIPLIGGWFQSL